MALEMLIIKEVRANSAEVFASGFVVYVFADPQHDLGRMERDGSTSAPAASSTHTVGKGAGAENTHRFMYGQHLRLGVYGENIFCLVWPDQADTSQAASIDFGFQDGGGAAQDAPARSSGDMAGRYTCRSKNAPCQRKPEFASLYNHIMAPVYRLGVPS
jgi:hypothetical protein